MARTVEVDQDTCIGAANCEYWAPATFEVEDMVSRVIDPDGDDDEALIRAEEGCPSGAITVEL